MPKHYEFHSKLSPAQIFARMGAYQMNVKRSGKWGDWWLEYRRKKGNGFSLYMSNSREIFVIFPFLGTVEPEGEGSVIRGRFALLGNNLRTFLILWGVPAFSAMLMGAFMFGMITSLVSAAIMFSLFWTAGQNVSGPVLNYIENNLLE